MFTPLEQQTRKTNSNSYVKYISVFILNEFLSNFNNIVQYSFNPQYEWDENPHKYQNLKTKYFHMQKNKNSPTSLQLNLLTFFLITLFLHISYLSIGSKMTAKVGNRCRRSRDTREVYSDMGGGGWGQVMGKIKI